MNVQRISAVLVLFCSACFGQTTYRAELTSVPGLLTVAGAPAAEDIVTLSDNDGSLLFEFEISEDRTSFSSLLFAGEFSPSLQPTPETLLTADVSVLHVLDPVQSAENLEQLPDGRWKTRFSLNRLGATSSARAFSGDELLEEHLDQTLLRPAFNLPTFLNFENGELASIQLELGGTDYAKRNSQPDEGFRAITFGFGDSYTTPPIPVYQSPVPEPDSYWWGFWASGLIALSIRRNRHKRAGKRL